MQELLSGDLAIAAVILSVITAMGLLVSQRSYILLALLAVQYISVFILAGLNWSLEMTLSKLIAGWISVGIIGWILFSTRTSTDLPSGELLDSPLVTSVSVKYGDTVSATVFRLLASVLVGLTMLSASPTVASWVPGIPIEAAMGGLLLVGLGLLQLGLSTQPLRVIIGLLTVLSGFEIIYSAVEISALVAGLLTAVTMGLAIIGAFIILLPVMEELE